MDPGSIPGISTIRLVASQLPHGPEIQADLWRESENASMIAGAFMPKNSIATGVVHTVPADIKKMLEEYPDVLELWNGLTPLARNEWICWATIVKQAETRADHIRQISERLRDGERRPCCWPGCPHRNPKAAKWFKRKPA